jgi:hypothetical protein
MSSSAHSLNSALERGEWSASRPRRFSPRERDPDIHWIGGCEPQSRSGRGREEKIFQPLPGLEPPIIQPIVQCYATELSRLLLLFH